MTQSLDQFRCVVENFQQNHADKWPIAIQKVYSSHSHLIFKTRSPGESLYLFLGRGNRFSGIEVKSENIFPQERIQERYLQYARSNWQGALIHNILSPFNDRFLECRATKKNKTLYIYFFWRGRDLFFADFSMNTDGELTLFFSWQGKRLLKNQNLELAVEIIHAQFREIGLEKNSSREKANKTETILGTNQKSGKKSLDKKISLIEREIAKNESYKAFEKILLDEDLYSNKDEIIINNRKISFKDCENDFQRRDNIFQMIKRMKKGLEIQKKRLEDIKIKSVKKIDQKEKITSKKLKVIQPIWAIEKETTIQKKDLLKSNAYFTIVQNETQIGWLGKNSHGNDFIRSKLSKNDHWWFHLEHYPSSHFYLKSSERPQIEDIVLFASMIRDQGHLEILEIPIIYTKVKDLKGLKGVAGAVTFKNEKRLTVHYDQEWRQKLAQL